MSHFVFLLLLTMCMVVLAVASWVITRRRWVPVLFVIMFVGWAFVLGLVP